MSQWSTSHSQDHIKPKQLTLQRSYFNSRSAISQRILNQNRPKITRRIAVIAIGVLLPLSAIVHTSPAAAQPSIKKARSIFDSLPDRIKRRTMWDPFNECVPTGKSETGEVMIAFIHDLPWIRNTSWEETKSILDSQPAGQVSKLLNNHPSESIPEVIKEICLSHINDHDYEDIGYNFLIDDKSGDIYEGRASGINDNGTPRSGIEQPIVSTETKGYNKISTNFAVIGDFRIQKPSDRTIESLAALAAWKLNLHKVDLLTKVIEPDRLSPETDLVIDPISAHRDVLPTSQCPGDRLYESLPLIRQLAIELIREESPGDKPDKE